MPTRLWLLQKLAISAVDTWSEVGQRPTSVLVQGYQQPIHAFGLSLSNGHVYIPFCLKPDENMDLLIFDPSTKAFPSTFKESATIVYSLLKRLWMYDHLDLSFGVPTSLRSPDSVVALGWTKEHASKLCLGGR